MAALDFMLCLVALVVLMLQVQAVEVAGPAAKVISLLGRLQVSIKKEGEKEAAEYDKAACYCKDEVDSKQHAIEVSTKKIANLDAGIAQLKAEVDELDGYTEEGDTAVAVLGSIKTLENTIVEKEAVVATATAKRAEDHAAYVAEVEEIADAIGSSIAALEDTKAALKDAKIDLLQEKLLKLYSSSHISPSHADLRAIKALALVQQLPKSVAEAAEKPAYEFKSNGIIDILKGLLAGLKAQKLTVGKEEQATLHAFEMNLQALNHEVSFAAQGKRQQESSSAEKNAELSQLVADREAEQAAMSDDSAYLQEMTIDCESKATQFDQRSKARSDELQAMTQAVAMLKAGANGASGAAASFLQLRSRSSSAAALATKVADLARSEAKRLHSASLSGLALKLNMGSPGKLGNMVGMIEDLLVKLAEEQKTAEAQAIACNESLKESLAKMDGYKLDVNTTDATIDTSTAEKNRLTDEVFYLAEEMANLRKALLEGTELRNEEKANNERAILEAEEGEKSVNSAIEVIEAFYGSSSLLQARRGGRKQDPSTSDGAKDRDGKSVGDAPKLSYAGDYSGKQAASKHVVGMLEVISADFVRAVENVKSDESSAAADFAKFETDTEQDLVDKQTLKDEKEANIKATTVEINEATDAGVATKKLLKNANEEYDNLGAMCRAGMDDRNARAMTIISLEDIAQKLKSGIDMLDALSDHIAEAEEDVPVI